MAHVVFCRWIMKYLSQWFINGLENNILADNKMKSYA